MNKVVRYKAKDASKGMTADEIRKALADVESTGTIITIKAVNGFNGKLHCLAIESTMEKEEDKGVQA